MAIPKTAPAPKNADEALAALTKFESYEVVEIHRSSIKNAPYNPRTITKEAKAKMQKKISAKGLLGPIIWNRASGNIVGGHQRISCVDALEGHQNYKIRVASVVLTPKEEREWNIYLNNSAAQGEWDYERLEQMIKQTDIDVIETGFDINDIRDMFGTDAVSLSAEKLLELAEEVRDLEARRKAISSRLVGADDDGPEFYSVVVFKSPEERARFLSLFGLSNDKYLNAHILMESMQRMGLKVDLKAINEKENIFFDVSHCPRCGCSHEDMMFMPLAEPQDRNHWALCPTVGQPILVHMEWVGEDFVVAAGLEYDQPLAQEDLGDPPLTGSVVDDLFD